MLYLMILVASWIIFQLATWKVAELALKLSREHGCSPWKARMSAWRLFFRWGWTTIPPTLTQKKIHGEVETSP